MSAALDEAVLVVGEVQAAMAEAETGELNTNSRRELLMLALLVRVVELLEEVVANTEG